MTVPASKETKAERPGSVAEVPVLHLAALGLLGENELIPG